MVFGYEWLLKTNRSVRKIDAAGTGITYWNTVYCKSGQQAPQCVIRVDVKRKTIVMISMCCMILTAVISSCTAAENPGEVSIPTGSGQETQSAGSDLANISSATGFDVSLDPPEYGGSITLTLDAAPVFDLLGFDASCIQLHANQRLFEGDWAKGPAGGYGEGLTDWGESTNIPSLMTGYLVSSYSWMVSGDGTDVTANFIVRENVRFAQTDTEAGKLVGGRLMTVDDIVWNINQRLHNDQFLNYQLYPAQRYAIAVKTGENSFSITFLTDDFFDTMTRLNRSSYIFPPELWDAFEKRACTDWRYSVGTGPYVITTNVDNVYTLERNPDCWMTDPAGPGKGNPLPYIQTVKYYVMPDTEVREVCFRTGKIDRMADFTAAEKDAMAQSASKLFSAERGSASQSPLFMNTTVPPFDDIRVRKALLMATDFQSINEDLYNGDAQIISWPYYRVDGYEPLYVSPDDIDLPDDVKQLYTYNPNYARQLLEDAGYFSLKTSLLMSPTDADYYAMIAAQWTSVGIRLEMLPCDFNNLVSTMATVGYEGLVGVSPLPVSSFPGQHQYTARNWMNGSLINEEYVEIKAAKVKETAVTDFETSMEDCRALILYLLEQAYVIPAPRYPLYTMWWPWLKNYSGENTVGYYPGNSWIEWCWVDTDLKASMGY
jgi:ABC-type transport system substrate-binding protein